MYCPALTFRMPIQNARSLLENVEKAMYKETLQPFGFSPVQRSTDVVYSLERQLWHNSLVRVIATI